MISRHGASWEAYLGKAEDVLPVLDPVVTLLLTDPPYGVDHQSNWRPQPIAGDTADGRAAVYKVLSLSVSLFARSNQHLYVFGDWDLTQVKSVFKSIELVWDKIGPAMGDLDIAWSRNYEHIQFAAGRASRTKGDGLMRKRKGAVLRQYAITGKRAFRHPTEKPVSLLRDLVESSSTFGDVVLDPYMGSGSSGVAALLEGRRFIGIEQVPEHFETACARLTLAEDSWQGVQGL